MPSELRAAAEPHPSLVATVRELAPRIVAAADAIERARRLPLELVSALASLGVFRMCVPRALGGGELPVSSMLDVIEELAAADGSAGWVATIGATSGLVSAYLPGAAAREIYGDPDAVTGGVFAPSGSATVVDGGYRVTGRWSFASGAEHCAWLMGGSVLVDDGRPRTLPDGTPDARLMLFPARAVEVLDTWYVSGLRGTGSQDMRVTDVFVPTAHAVSLITDRPCAGALYAFPVFGLLALGIAAVGLGVARRAIAELVTLAGGKTPTGARRLLADRPAVQAQVAEAEATLGAARAFLRAEVAAAWHEAEEDGTIEIGRRARLRLAATHATASAARAVDLMYTAGGGTAVYASSPLQRCFRDVHVVTQHMMVAAPTLELVGRVLLGRPTDTALL